MPFLENAILKLRRAEEQQRFAFSKIEDITSGKNLLGLKYTRETSAPDTYIYSIYISHIPEFGKEIGILLGEAIQSYRVALDYLIWELYKNNNTNLTPKQELQIAFPTCENKDDFIKQVEKKLPFITKQQKALLEKYQPYNESESGYAIRYLKVLSNIDKHRIIVPIFTMPNKAEASLNTFDNFILSLTKEYIDGHELKNDLKLFTIATTGNLEKWAGAQIKIQAIPAYLPEIIKPPSQYEYVSLEKVFTIIHQACFDVLLDFKSDTQQE